MTIDPLDERIVALRREGRTATEIAAAVGGGLSRNAVIGRLHRAKAKGVDVAVAAAGRPKSDPSTTDPLDERIVALRREGRTTAEIAATVALSRNVVLDRLHRAKAKGVDVALPKIGRPKSGPSTAEGAAKPVVIRAEPDDPTVSIERRLAGFARPVGVAGVRLEDLSLTECRWPFDGPEGATLFCDAPQTTRCYCEAHASRAFARVLTPAERRAHAVAGRLLQRTAR